jgi:hypothetical protein
VAIDLLCDGDASENLELHCIFTIEKIGGEMAMRCLDHLFELYLKLKPKNVFDLLQLHIGTRVGSQSVKSTA